MIVELRIYKRFDQDLIALKKLGADLGKLIKEDLYAFARGKQVFFAIPADAPVDLEDRHSFHFRINITDAESIKLLKSVKNSYRNSFCKALLRESFVYQALGVYLADPGYIEKRNEERKDLSVEYTECGLRKAKKKHIDKPKTADAPPVVSRIKRLSDTPVKETRKAKTSEQAENINETIDINEAFSKLLF